MAFARPILPLFRPLAAPKPATAAQLLRFSHCARLRQQAEVATASTTAPTDPNAEPAEQILLPYFVSRTPSTQLPVYLENKRGGNLKLTKVRKISGNAVKLRDELREYLDLPEKEIIVNPVTQSIIAKGQHRTKIIKFLESKKF